MSSLGPSAAAAVPATAAAPAAAIAAAAADDDDDGDGHRHSPILGSRPVTSRARPSSTCRSCRLHS